MRYLLFSGLVLIGCSSSNEASTGDGTETEGSSNTDGATETSPSGTTSTSGTTVGATDSQGASTEAVDSSTSSGPGEESGSSSTGVAACDVSADAVVSGRVWVDTDATDASTYIAQFVEGTDEGAGGEVVQLIGTDSVEETTTCDDGRYGFADAQDGTYLVAAPGVPDGQCAQKNCARRLPAAIEEGMVKIVTIGDSVPVQGDPVPFPGRVADLLSPLAAVDDVNAAISGSTSTQWIPGGAYWDSEVLGNLDDADVLVISVGGNDFLGLISGADITNIPQVLADAQALVIEVTENVREISIAAREAQPGIDVVYCIYPDYSTATQTPPWSTASLLPAGTIYNLLAQARDLIQPEDEVIVVDLLEASLMLDVPLDDLLADALHFNDAGHQFYAYEIFKALGGVELGAAPVGDVHNWSSQPNAFQQ